MSPPWHPDFLAQVCHGCHDDSHTQLQPRWWHSSDHLNEDADDASEDDEDEDEDEDDDVDNNHWDDGGCSAGRQTQTGKGGTLHPGTLSETQSDLSVGDEMYKRNREGPSPHGIAFNVAQLWGRKTEAMVRGW